MADQDDANKTDIVEICDTCGRDVIFKKDDGDFCGICKKQVAVVPKSEDGPFGC